MSADRLVVAIDGPSGVGKTTVARRVAEALGVPYLETGAMYRALGLEAVERGIDPDDAVAAGALAESVDVRVVPTSDGRLRVLVGGEDPGERLRTPAVSDATSRIAVHPEVRRRMVALQRRCAERWGGVVEGRDIGSRVFPDTPYKFFLDAPDDVRVERRRTQLVEGGAGGERGEVEAELRRRDDRDSRRVESPLTWDETYVIIDTGELTIDEVVERILAVVRGGDG